MIIDNIPDFSKEEARISSIRDIIDRANNELPTTSRLNTLGGYAIETDTLVYDYSIFGYAAQVGYIKIYPKNNQIKMSGTYGYWYALRQIAQRLPQDMEITLDVYK